MGKRLVYFLIGIYYAVYQYNTCVLKVFRMPIKEKRRRTRWIIIEEKIARVRSNIHLASVKQLKTVRSIVGASVHGFLTFKSRVRRRRKKVDEREEKITTSRTCGKMHFCHSFRYLNNIHIAAI